MQTRCLINHEEMPFDTLIPDNILLRGELEEVRALHCAQPIEYSI
ncbi:MAG TPA: hypothetical protein VM821_01800 [Abditibacteriaceae bacterium]|nr:hypothetical protein [Abditibacteriaceae bacterium]